MNRVQEFEWNNNLHIIWIFNTYYNKNENSCNSDTFQPYLFRKQSR